MGFVGTVFSAYNIHIAKLSNNQYPIHNTGEGLDGVLQASPSQLFGERKGQRNFLVQG